MAQVQGTIVPCIGAVTDIQFDRDKMPGIYDALILEDDPTNTLAEKGLTFEVEQQLGDGIVRTIAMGSSDGLKRGMKVRNRASPIARSSSVMKRSGKALVRPCDHSAMENVAAVPIAAPVTAASVSAARPGCAA